MCSPSSRAVSARTARHELDYGFEDVIREIRHLIGQMSDEELLDVPEGEPLHELQSVRNERMGSDLEK